MARHDLLAATLEKFNEPRRDAANRALALLAEAQRAVDEIDVMHSALRNLGGHHVDLQARKTLEYLAVRLRKIGRAE
ncbi:hypothetical protein RSO01_82120 [Reyranella soli]|uniref:Uncharacterized protein n=2 Tax=Reyranella soli TaxID=1230389 RepID=A0A512NQ17_9HYPH|nr:hypothetical protein RSO01_82120 [Reyranella soli]